MVSEGVVRGDRGRQPAWRFCLLFVGLSLALVALTSMTPAAGPLHGLAGRALAATARPILALAGRAGGTGIALEFDGFHAAVEDACDGILPAILYAAAIIAFPCGWRRKLLGLAAGLPILFAVNVFRVICLMIIGAHWPGVFDQAHIYVWQVVVIGASLGVWALWAEYSLASPPERRV